MKVPSLLQGQSLARLIQGAAVGAVVTMIIGFNWGGWTTRTTSEKMAAEHVQKAQIAILAPLCHDKFLAMNDAVAQRAVLQKTDSWRRRDVLPKEWATLPGDSYANSNLVEACSDLILNDK